jgi:YD repeat-containing protein
VRAGSGKESVQVANRLSTVTDWNSNQTWCAYDDAHSITTTTLPNRVVSMSSYDNANRRP